MNKCLSTYKFIKNFGFSSKALKLLFDNTKVSPYLDFETPEYIYNNEFEYNIRQISI